VDANERRAIEQDCRALIMAMAQYCDRREFVRALALYVPECEWVRMGAVYAGQSAIKRAYESLPSGRVTRHVTGGTVITVVDDDHAEGLTYYLSFTYERDGQEDADVPMPLDSPVSMGEWQDRFVCTPDGWRFERRTTTRIFERKCTPRSTT
jgi:hypothetical protein